MFLARNWTEEGLKKAFMNGEGLWIKGDIPAWYDQNTVDFYIKSHEIYRDHRDAFSSGSPEPFVPTLIGNVYAHRFAKGDKVLFTFYNANWREVSGSLADVGGAANRRVVDLWQERILEPTSTINTRLAPRDIGCVVVMPRLLNAQCINGDLIIGQLEPVAGSTLELTAVYGGKRVSKVIPGYPTNGSISLAGIFEEFPGTLLVKLKVDGVVQDLVILNGLQPPSGEVGCSAQGMWVHYE
jgi:hypothetical protein